MMASIIHGHHGRLMCISQRLQRHQNRPSSSLSPRFTSPFATGPLLSKPASKGKHVFAAVKRGSDHVESSELGSSSSSGSVGDEGTPRQFRNLLVTVDNSEDADYSVSWTIDHLYRPGDKIHLLHCISRIPRDRDFTRKADGTGLEASVPLTLVDSVVGGPRKEVLRRHWETREAIRGRFEANVLQKGVPEEDLVYDVVEETLPRQNSAAPSLFGVAGIDLGAAAAVPVAPLPSAAPGGARQGGEEGRTRSQREQAALEFVTEGMAGDAIVTRAEELGAAAVVLASRSKGAFQEFLVGSITNFCTHHCSRPVVVLHNPRHSSSSKEKEEEAPGEEPAAAAGGNREISVAVDNSPHSEQALLWTLKNMYRHGDLLRLIHVVPNVGTQVAFADGFGHGVGRSVALPSANADDGVAHKYEELLNNSGVPYKVDLIHGHNSSVETLGTAIVNKVQEVGASSLVMASHSPSPLAEFFAGSVTNHVTHHCGKVPVVVLHP